MLLCGSHGYSQAFLYCVLLEETKMNYTSQELMLLIKDKYTSHKGSFDPTVVLEEVPNGTGGHQSRWIDAAACQGRLPVPARVRG